MESMIKVLMLEDTLEDATLIQKTLQRADFNFESKVVSTREDFVKALDIFSPDLILSDHQLPQFSSTEALEICRTNHPFLPFILVTGAVSEEFAASIIRNGADDYLLKNNLKRLPTAIRQAIQRRKTEQSLAQSIDRYEMVSRATHDAIWDWDIVSGTTTWNYGVKTLFGFDVQKVHDSLRWWEEKIHPEDRERVLAEVEKTFKMRSETWTSSYRFKHSGDGFLHVLDRARVIYKDGLPVRMIGAMQDIDDRVRTLEEVRRLSIVASKTDNSVLILDKDSRIEWVNDSFTRLSGYTLAEVTGKTPLEFLHGKETNAFIANQLMSKGKLLKPFTEEILNYSKDGRKYWVRVTVTPVLNDKGELDKFVSIQSDVSDHKEFERNITAVAREWTSFIENSNATIFGVDRNGYLNEWNKITAELTGFGKNEVLGKKWIDFLDTKVHESVLGVLAKVLKGQPTDNYELPFVNKGGKFLILSISISPRFDIDKNIKGAICVGQDVTEIFQYRQNLERMVEERTSDLNEALKKEKILVELKNKFVSIASHEFRTPLATISFAAESIRSYFEKLSADDIKKKLIKIEDQATHMNNLLEDILIIGKSEAGKIKVIRVSLNLKEFVQSLVEEVKTTAKEKREIIYTFSCANLFVKMDDKLLRNVIINLLTNALKFSTTDKNVVLTVSDIGEQVLIEVSDQGIGINEDEMHSIFESFQRGSNVSAIQGTGLGLSILKKATDLMGGTIQVESVVNKGSTFKVQLPVT